MFKMLAATAAVVLLTATPAAAGDHPEPRDQIGWFSPTFTNSPVNLIVCAVPESCRF